MAKTNLIVKRRGSRDRVFYGVSEVRLDEENNLTWLNASLLPCKLKDGDWDTFQEVEA